MPAHKDALDDHNKVFYCLLKQEIMYHSTSYSRYDGSKRNNTFCVFLDSAGRLKFGQINIFLYHPKPCALIYEMIVQNSSLTEQAGHTSHRLLISHERVDILNDFIVPVKLSES